VIVETAPVDPLSFVQYGILGVILIMLLTGWLWAKPAVEEMQKRHAEERKLWEDRILPTMERLSRELDKNAQEMRINTNELAEAIRFLERRSGPDSDRR
jgi:hypothetical protein